LPTARTRTPRRWVWGSWAKARDLVRRALEIVGRADPQGHGFDAQGLAPVQDLVELARTQAIDFAGFGQLSLLAIAAIAVENDPHVARHRLLAKLAQQPVLVDVVEQARHRRTRFAVARFRAAA
jgi:hypothetical protein